jgi:hypothetical protein
LRQSDSIEPELFFMEKECLLSFVTPGADCFAVSEGHCEILFSTFDACEATS